MRGDADRIVALFHVCQVTSFLANLEMFLANYRAGTNLLNAKVPPIGDTLEKLCMCEGLWELKREVRGALKGRLEVFATCIGGSGGKRSMCPGWNSPGNLME